MTLVSTIPSTLDARRKKLGVSCASLAEQTGLSLRTIQRLFSGQESDPGLSTVCVVAEALGMELRLEASRDPQAFRLEQASRKADRLVAMVQGTSALESQGIGPEALRELHQRTVNELLAGSNRRLWAR
jgi:transcriptional regulator with XRE-family HTH domain